MRVLTTVFTYARHVALDVANIQLAFVEWWREKDDQAVAPAYQIFFNRGHCALRSITFSRTGNHRPRLHNRVDATFIVLHGAKRSTVIKISAAIPVTVPTFFCQRLFQLLEMLAIAIAAWRFVPLIAQGRKRLKRGVEKPADPNALALAQFSHAVHAIVPVAAAHQWQAVFADCQT